MTSLAIGSPEPDKVPQPSAPAPAATPKVDLESVLNDLEKPGVDEQGFDGVFDKIAESFNTAAMDTGKPVPVGTYHAILHNSELTRSKKKQTPGYELDVEISGGDHKGRHLSMSLWLISKTIGRTKYFLHKLGIFDLRQLKNPLPKGFEVEIEVEVDSNNRWNQVKDFRVVKSPGGGSSTAVEVRG